MVAIVDAEGGIIYLREQEVRRGVLKIANSLFYSNKSRMLEERLIMS